MKGKGHNVEITLVRVLLSWILLSQDNFKPSKLNDMKTPDAAHMNFRSARYKREMPGERNAGGYLLTS